MNIVPAAINPQLITAWKEFFVNEENVSIVEGIIVPGKCARPT